MPYICNECENKTRFTAVHDVTQWGSEDVTLDENGDVDDSDGFCCNDQEITEVRDLECSNCNSGDIIHVSDDDWEAWEGPSEHDPDIKEDDESWETFMSRRQEED